MQLVDFYYKNISRCTVLWMSKTLYFSCCNWTQQKSKKQECDYIPWRRLWYMLLTFFGRQSEARANYTRSAATLWKKCIHMWRDKEYM